MPLDEGAKPAEADEEIQVGKRGVMPFILLAVGALLLGAGGTYFAVDMFGSESGAEASDADKGAGSADADGKIMDTKVTDLGKFTVNLRDSANTQRVLQLQVQVESELETAVKVEERMPQLRDSVILLASDYSYSELEGMDGKLRLRDEIQARINSVLDPDNVERVYYTAFVVQ